MAEEKQKSSGAQKAVKAAKAVNTAKQVAKAGAQAAAGNYAGAVKEILKDENLRGIIITLIVILCCIPVMMFSMVPSVLFLPSEDAYSVNDTSASFWDIIKGLFTSSDETDSLLDNGMKDEQSLKVVADSDTTEADFDTAPTNADDTMTKMLNIVMDRYDKRHEKLLDYINDDFNKRKDDYSGTVYKTVNDVLANGATTSEKEAIKLMALYTVQTDGVITDKTFMDFRDWLGDEDSGFFKEKDSENYSGWYEIPKKWQGTMLTQALMDQAAAEKEAGTYNESDYEDYYTSALSEVLTVDPEVEVNEVWDTDDDGNDYLAYTTLTYTIDVKSVDEICEEVVKFDEAVETDSDGNPLKISGSSYRSEYYKELVGDGENEGIALEYFGITTSGLYSGSYSGGNGAGIVAVALEEVGAVETPVNNVKYNTWLYGHVVSGSEYPWCCAFVAWCADQCGLIDSGVILKTAGCSTMLSYLKSQGCLYWSTSDTSQTPQPGDFVIRGNGNHIGIVEKYEDGILYTIEGNSGTGISEVNNNGGCVARHAYSDIDGSWYGTFVRPNYPTSIDSGVGAVCFAFETGGQTLGQANPWYCGVLNDGAGTNYGMMSTNGDMAKNMLEYIKANSENFASQIGSMQMFTTEFNSWWTGSHSEADTEEMSALQSAWVWQAYGETACEGEYSYLKRSRALQEMVLARSVHRGVSGARGMFKKAGISESMTDEEIINAVYDYEAANITAGSYTNSVRARMNLERQMILDNFM